MVGLQSQPVWLLLAVASGACAAFNGVFAKLYETLCPFPFPGLSPWFCSPIFVARVTTTDLTASWSTSLSTILSLSPTNSFVNYLLRASFFGLNLLFNVAMWSLFTAALTRAFSTVRVSIINVSSNFVVTAFLGLVIFGESLPPLWWMGAALLVAGTVVIGARRDEDKEKAKVGLAEGRAVGDAAAGLDEGLPLMQDEMGQDDNDMIDLDGGIVEDSNLGPVPEGEDVDIPKT